MKVNITNIYFKKKNCNGILGPGYLSFIAIIIGNLEYDSPVGTAFLSHVIDKSSLPSRKTLFEVSPVIVARLNKKPSRIQRMISVLAAKKRPVYSDAANVMVPVNQEQAKVKRNAATLWALLADKFAGELCLSLWTKEVGETLSKSLSDPHEDLTVRIFSLLALEKFANTGIVFLAYIKFLRRYI